MGVSKNSVFFLQIIHFNRVFHDFHHPFRGTPIFLKPEKISHPSHDPTGDVEATAAAEGAVEAAAE